MGYPGRAWCAVFVSWCAKHANVAETIIIRHADCDTIKNFFMNQGTFNYSSAQGGNYIPTAGDIVFKGVTIEDSTHVGIVEKVVGQYVYMIDGNGPGGVVARRTFKLTASNVLGYGHPNYASTEHIASEYSYTNEAHSGTCANCGATFEETHDMHNECIDSAKHKSVCSKCEYTGGTFNHIIGAVLSSDSESHWYACGGCGYRAQEEAHTCGTYQSNSLGHWRVCTECGTKCDNASHVFITSLDGTKVCRTCGYVGYSSVVVQRATETMN